MSYRITVTSIETKDVLETFTYYFNDEEMVERKKKNPEASSYQTMTKTVTKPVETQIFQQTVDELSLTKVIDSINH